MQVANRCCKGRIVSALEGGYRIQGKIVSAFARSVAAHVRALMEPNYQVPTEAYSRYFACLPSIHQLPNFPGEQIQI
jgi:acetoin utilization deacetylase AcuC-like enzyme